MSLLRWAALGLQPVLATPAPTAEPAALVAPAASEAIGQLEAEVEAALEAFRQRRFAVALSHFESATALTSDTQASWDLRFNAAVCVFELGRFGEAEQRFIQLGEQGEANRADEAWLHAGFAALRQSALERAESHARRANSSSPATRALAARLLAQLAAARDQRETNRVTRSLDTGLTALERRQYAAAERALSDVAANPRVHPSLRARALHGLAAIAQAEGDSAQALTHLNGAISENPDAPELYVSRARVLAVLGKTSSARPDYATAARLLDPTDPEQARKLRDEASALYLLPRSGWGLQLGLSSGYDSNVTQSGTAATFLPASLSDSPSPFIAGSGSVARPLRFDEYWALTPAYQLFALAFTQSDSRDLSIVSHDLGVELAHALSFDTSLSIGVGARYATSGLDGLPFTAQGYGRLGAQWRQSVEWSGRALVEYRRQWGFREQDYLTGHAIDVSLHERWARGDLRLGAELGLVSTWLGTQHLAASGDCETGSPFSDFAGPGFGGPDFDDPDGPGNAGQGFGVGGADDACATGTIWSPLSYLAPGIDAYVELQASQALLLSLFGGYEYRYYLGTSTLLQSDLVVSEADRRDRRFQLGLQLNWDIGALPGTSLFGRYALHIVRSNVAESAVGWRRAWASEATSLDDESDGYEQHVPELGVLVRY